MLITRLRKIQKQLTLSLLLALSGVFVCDFLCDFGLLDIRIYSDQSASVFQEHSQKHDHSEATGDHRGDHSIAAEAHTKGDDHTDHQHHNDKDKDEDECCDEETSQLLASLIRYELPTFETTKISILLHAVVFEQEITRFIVNKKPNLYELNSSLSPPSGGHLLRILYQSFLC